MNRMQALIKAAMITGLISLAGVSYLLYAVFTAPAEVSSPRVFDNPVAQVEPQEQVQIEPQAKPKDEVKPSGTIMRRTSYAVPGYSAIKQVALSFPAIKRQVDKHREEQRKLEDEEKRLLEEQERAFFDMEVTPPAEQQQNVKEEKTEAAKPVISELEEKKVIAVNKPALPAAEVPLAANQASNNETNRKQQVLQSGRPLPVREMQKRFDGTLTSHQLSNVLNDIFGAKGEQDSDATCVHIKSLPETEVTAKQLTVYLLQNGFTMAGRGEASTKDKGIKVDASGVCVVVTVGKM